MIRIIIHSFRGVGSTKENPTPKVYEFHRGLNLLKGESGRGKSTIINAFRWCLYKEPLIGNNSLLKNASSKSPKVSVEFRTSELNFIITRTGSPNLLEVIHEGGMCETQILLNEEAEVFIQKLFGKEHYWRSCCFIQQGHHNPILDGLSASDKREVFQTMSVNSANHKLEVDIPIDTMRTNISTMRKSLESEEKVKEGVVKTMEEQYRKMTSEICKPIFEESYSTEDVFKEEWNIPLTKILTEISMCKIDNDADTIKTQMGELQLQLDNLHKLSVDVQKNRSKNETIIERNQKRLLEHDHIMQTVMDLGKLYPSLIQSRKWLEAYTVKEYLEKLIVAYGFVKSCIDYMEYIGHDVPNTDKWSSYGSLLKADLDFLPSFKNYIESSVQKKNLQMSFDKFSDGLKKNNQKLQKLFADNEWLSGKNYTDLCRELSNHLKNTDGQVVSCPGCHKKIIIRNTVASIYDNEDSIEVYRRTLQHRITAVNQVIQLSNTIQDQTDQLQVLEDRIDNIHIDETFAITPEKLVYIEAHGRKIYEQYPAMKKNVPVAILDALQKNLDSSFLMDVQRVLKDLSFLLKYETITQLNDEIEEAKLELSMSTINHVESAKLKEKEVIEKLQILKQQMAAIHVHEKLMEKLHNSFPGLNTDRLLNEDGYIHFLVRLNNYRKQLAEYDRQVEKNDQYHQELTSEQETMGMIRKKINHLLELNKILDETEEEIFENTIQTITTKVNDLLENIFEQNPPRLIVKNEVKKTAKTSRDIQFFFATTADNVSQSDSIRNITTYSGGEADRLSLAFTCAAAGFSDCPLLFLDECISSLDTELRDKVIRTLRTVVKEKFVIVVAHDTVDGLFDNVVLV